MTSRVLRAALLGLLMTVASGVPLAAQTGLDWSRVTESDLNIASVFLTGRAASSGWSAGTGWDMG